MILRSRFLDARYATLSVLYRYSLVNRTFDMNSFLLITLVLLCTTQQHFMCHAAGWQIRTKPKQTKPPSELILSLFYGH